MKIVLASASPRRAALLRRAGIDFSVCPSRADESSVTGLSPQMTAINRARLKAEEVFARTGGIVLGADTVVAKDGKIFGKPADEAAAFVGFRALCGAVHEVITSVYLISEQARAQTAVSTRVTFKPYDRELVSAYIATGKPMDKAGGYGIQDKEIGPLIQRIDGGADNAMGLPVGAVLKLLEENFKWR